MSAMDDEYQITRSFLYDTDPVTLHDFLKARSMFRSEINELVKDKGIILTEKEKNRMTLNLMRRTRAADPMRYAKLIRDMRGH